MARLADLTGQSLVAALIAAYVAPLILFAFDLVWRIQTGADARICPAGSRELSDWCTMAEMAVAFLFVFLWAIYGLPFAAVITVPIALGLGRLAPRLERKFDARMLAVAQFGLGAASGLIAACLLDVSLGDGAPSFATAVAGLLAALMGVCGFRFARYSTVSG
jgi:hypothetical protein